MKRILLASAGLFVLAGSIGAADAADLSRPPPPPLYKAAPYVPVYNWTGLYAGINGGYGWGTSNWSALPSNLKPNGGLVGGQIGYNWQFGQFVYGLEGDADWADFRGNSGIAGCGLGVCQTKSDYLATVRGRLGYAIDRFLPYVTGGLAVGDIRTTSPLVGGVDTTNAGWTVGGGVEFALSGPWTAKVEYLHVDLGNTSCGTSCGFPAGNTVSLKEDIVRGGINYRF
jgi:outer membrane immunogenic protein